MSLADEICSAAQTIMGDIAEVHVDQADLDSTTIYAIARAGNFTEFKTIHHGLDYRAAAQEWAQSFLKQIATPLA